MKYGGYWGFYEVFGERCKTWRREGGNASWSLGVNVGHGREG